MVINPAQFPDISIPIPKVLARLGFAHGKTKLDEITMDIINEEVALCTKLIHPQQVIAHSRVTLQGKDAVSLEPDLHIRSTKIYELLSNCSKAYGFAVTIGSHLEDKRNEYLNTKDTSRAVIVDAIGSVMAEELAELTHAQIQSEEQGPFTMRFSPGYGDWQLSGQTAFLAWLGAERIGIKLTDKYQMIPEKSVSAILGVQK